MTRRLSIIKHHANLTSELKARRLNGKVFDNLQFSGNKLTSGTSKPVLVSLDLLFLNGCSEPCHLIYSCLNGSVNCRFIDWPVKNLLMRTKVAIDNVPEVIVYDQKAVDYQAPYQFNLRAEGKEVEWQGV